MAGVNMANPDYDSVTNILDLWRQANVATDNLYTYLFLLTTFIIIYLSMQAFDSRQAMVSATFGVSIISLLLFVANVATFTAFISCLILFGASILWLVFGGEN